VEPVADDASPAAEVDDDNSQLQLQSPHATSPRPQQASPRHVHCSDDALASAENENNLNVESENNSVGDRSVEATGSAELSVENSGSPPPDSELGHEHDVAALPVNEQDNRAFLNDARHIGRSSGVPDASAAAATGDVYETELTEDHAVLSSCSAMIIDLPDDEFSDEEFMENVGKSETESCEPPLQPTSNKSSVGLQHLVDDKLVVIEQGQKSQPATRRRLNRNPQHFTEPAGTSESQHGSVLSDRKRSQKAEYDFKHSDMLPERTQERRKVAADTRGNNESIRPKQPKPDNSGRLSQSRVTHKSSVPKNPGLTQSKSGEVSRVKSKLLPDSVSATCPRSVSDESRKVRISQQCLTQNVCTPESQHGSAVLSGHKLSRKPQRDSKRAAADALPDVTPESGASPESDSLSKTQLEILELEMRARAIKAMIRAQEEMEQRLESAERRKHRSSDVADLDFAEVAGGQMPRHGAAPGVRRQASSSSTLRSRGGELRSLQSVIGRNIMRRAEYVARRQGRMQQQQRQQFVELEQRRMSHAASARTVRLPSDWRPVRCVVSSQSSPRVVRLRPGAAALPLTPRQRQRRFELRRGLVSFDNSRGDRRRVLVATDRRAVRMSSSGRPY